MNRKLIGLIAGLGISISIVTHAQPVWDAAADFTIGSGPSANSSTDRQLQSGIWQLRAISTPRFSIAIDAASDATNVTADNWSQLPCDCRLRTLRKKICPAMPCPAT